MFHGHEDYLDDVEFAEVDGCILFEDGTSLSILDLEDPETWAVYDGDEEEENDS